MRAFLRFDDEAEMKGRRLSLQVRWAEGKAKNGPPRLKKRGRELKMHLRPNERRPALASTKTTFILQGR
jgi:hypothetical protein